MPENETPHVIRGVLVLIIIVGFTVFADETEGLILALFNQHSQQHLKKIGGFGMNYSGRLSAHKVVKRRLVGIVLALVNLTRCHAVAEHFNNVFQRHFNRLNASRRRLVVGPILKVVLVAPLVMHPSKGTAE